MQKEMLNVVYEQNIDIWEFYDSLPKRTKEHCKRVAATTERILVLINKSNLKETELLPMHPKEISKAVLFHDIGIALIPERILNKVEELTSGEYKVLVRHARYGGKLIDKYRKGNKCACEKHEFWKLAAEIAVSHHERWDGRGYPFGLMTTAIPLVSRIVAVVDTYDSICNGTPYRMSLPHEYAILEIVDNSGSQFDPQIVEIFKQHAQDIYEVMQQVVLA